MTLFWLFIILLMIQRLCELLIARRNESAVRKMGAIEFDVKGYKFIVLMHVAFFVSLAFEYSLSGKTLNEHWLPLTLVFLLAQVLRYWSIMSLGRFWNTKILVVPGAPIIRKGPYRYFNHPNYLAVVIEIAVIPLIFSCYITSVIFSLLNLFVLRRRIGIEDSALQAASSGE